MNHIPKIILQTSKSKLNPYVVGIIAEKCRNWEYIHFTDDQITTFFRENPLEEFPLIEEKFNKIITGAHKSDLFRYYFLYINGGFHIDSDAKIEENIDTIIKTYDFVSVLSINQGTIFQGILGAIPKHPIIYQALKHAYSIDAITLNQDYMTFCKEMYNIIYNRGITYENIKIYKERNDAGKGMAVTYDTETKDDVEIKRKLFTHYYLFKTIPYKIPKPKTISEARIGITFTYPIEAMDIFTNGIKQNVLYFCDLLKYIGYDVYLIVLNSDFEHTTKYNFWNVEGKYKFVKHSELMNKFHMVIQMGYQLNEIEMDYLKEYDVKTVFYVCGNKYFIESESCLYKKGVDLGFQYNELNYSRFNEIWVIPQLTNSCRSYIQTLFRSKTFEVPFVWSPYVLENYESVLGKSIKYVNKGPQKSIGIFEPNLSLMKWCYPAILVCENGHRVLEDNSLIKYVYATNVSQTTNTLFDEKLLNKMVKSLDIFKTGKLSIEARFNCLYFMSKYTDIAVSHQTENNLNYLYLDLAWMGWPIIHNANLCKDVGYYYDGYDFDEGGNILKDVILNHDANVENYITKNRAVIDRYLPTNKDLQNAYKKLINNVLEISE